MEELLYDAERDLLAIAKFLVLSTVIWILTLFWPWIGTICEPLPICCKFHTDKCDRFAAILLTQKQTRETNNETNTGDRK